jgi:CO/xanthine dehydrogenase Mo-binding subunit
MANDRMTDYIVPTTVDIPPIRVIFESSTASSPAKGIGELPMDGPAPAIVNAILDATGVAIASVPATPEVIFDAFEGAIGARRA